MVLEKVIQEEVDLLKELLITLRRLINKELT
jgi:hypothetical protein